MESNLGGTQLGKYEIQAEIGRGGMGIVYKGYDPTLDRYVAVKVLAPHLVWEKEFVERFLREARAAARLKHAHIVTIHDVGQAAGWYYIVMEYLDRTLTDIIRQRGPLPPDEVLSILRPLADALDYAQRRGLVHRDIKPGNIMMDPAGQVTLTDFSIARAARETRLTATGTIMGTPEYMSPEQAKGETVDARSDQYGLAVVAYEMLSGKVPFEAESALALLHMIVYEPLPSIRQVNPDLPVAVEGVLKKALAKDPDDRYENTTTFVEALGQALAGEEVVKMPTLVMEPETVPDPTMAPTPEPSQAAAYVPIPEPEQTKVMPQVVQPAVAPTPEPDRAIVSEPAKVAPSDAQLAAPTRRRVPVWVWALGGLVVLALAVGGAIVLRKGDTTAVGRVEVVPTVGATSEGLNSVYFYGFNTTLEPFDDPLVRQAFVAALDRSALADLANTVIPEREYTPATTFTPSDILGLDLYDKVGPSYDPDYANELLEAAGYPRGEGLPEITLWYNETEDGVHKRIAEAVQAQWYAVFGIQVDLKTKAWDQYHDMVYNDPPQVWRIGWRADYVDPHNFLHDATCSSRNADFSEGEYSSMAEAIADAPNEATRRTRIAAFSNRACTTWSPSLFQWGNDEYTALLQVALQEPDEETRRNQYVQAERILCETDAVVIPLFHYHVNE